MLGAPVFAFLDSLGFQEMLILVVIGLLLYGRDLPQASRTLGRAVAKLKRGFQEFKDQIDREADIGEMKKTLQRAKDDLRQVTLAPRAIANPTQALRDLTNEALSSPLPGAQPETGKADLQAADLPHNGSPSGT
ncbi:MAG: twin-arginine translocase TatA/TatE family subunit [Planctomycetota bacterium]